MKLIFCLQIIVRFLQIDLSFWMCVARPAQIIKVSDKVTEVSDKVDFLHTDKHEILLQIETVTLMAMVKHFHSSQKSKFSKVVFTISQKRS